MVKGRNTIVVSVRIPDEVWDIINSKAKPLKLTVGQWIKDLVLREVKND